MVLQLAIMYNVYIYIHIYTYTYIYTIMYNVLGIRSFMRCILIFKEFILFIYIFKFLFIYFEREITAGKRQREGKREERISSRPYTVPVWGSIS